MFPPSPNPVAALSALPEYADAQNGHRAKGKTHRGRRAKAKSPTAHQADAQQHIAAAQKAPTPVASLSHLFKAVRSTHAAIQAAAPAPLPPSAPGADLSSM